MHSGRRLKECVSQTKYLQTNKQNNKQTYKQTNIQTNNRCRLGEGLRNFVWNPNYLEHKNGTICLQGKLPRNFKH